MAGATGTPYDALPMRYGIVTQGLEDPRRFGDFAAWIESLGFDHLWITDSSLHAGDAYVYATIALQATTILKVGVGVTNPLTRHVGVTANLGRSLSQLAPGRYICGLGAGDSPVFELGFRPAKLQTLRDTMTAMRRLWSGETLADEVVGAQRFWGGGLLTPVEPPPIYLAASGPRTTELAGECGDGVVLLAGLFPDALAAATQSLEAGRARSVRAEFATCCFLHGRIGPNEDEALDAARPLAAWYASVVPDIARKAGLSEELIAAVAANFGGGEFQGAVEAGRLLPSEVVRKLAFSGSPAILAAKLDWLRGTGIDAVSMFPLGPERRATISAFATLAFS